jgi:hypothetical protein
LRFYGIPEYLALVPACLDFILFPCLKYEILKGWSDPMKILALVVSIAFLTGAIAASFATAAFSQTASGQSIKPVKAGKKAPCVRSRNVACY